MSLTYVSPKRPNRVYVRKFDHDEARRRYAIGDSPKAMAKEYDVTVMAVWRVVSPVRAASEERRKQAERTAGLCDRCGGVMHMGSRYHGARLCFSCSRDDQATSVRPDTLQCSTCREWGPDDAFPSNRAEAGRRRGRHMQCRLCLTTARREYRRRNREKDNAYQREYRARRRAEARAAVQPSAEDGGKPSKEKAPSA